MRLASESAELTTAATDLLLAGIAAAGALLARRPLWRAAFAGLAGASLAGAAVHGLPLSAAASQSLWLLLNLGLGATVAVFALAVLRDHSGAAAARRAAPPLLLAGLGVGLAAQYYLDTFLPFILFNAAVLLACAASAWRRRRAALAAGCLLALLAGLVQASDWRIQLVWEFDHNGLFHLAQIPALLLWIRESRSLSYA